jgi:parallel beta-helix repeat protein
MVDQGSYYGLYANSASPTFTGNLVKNNRREGIFLSNSNAIVENNTIEGNQHGIHVAHNSSATITRNTVKDHLGSGIITSNSEPVTTENAISGNTNYGINNLTSSIVINAENNYWGHESGPLDDSDDTATGGLYNPFGQGDRVSDNVDYDPWLDYDPLEINQIVFDFSGTIISVEDTTTNQLLDSTGIEAGTSTFTGRIIYDPSAEPYLIPSPDIAWYHATEYSLTINGTYNFTIENPAITVSDNRDIPSRDKLEISVEDSKTLFDIPIERKYMSFQLFDYTTQAFNDTSLPPMIDLSEFDDGRISIRGWEDLAATRGYIIDGEINGVSRDTLTVTFPNGGESLTKGQDYTITWNSAGNIESAIQIDLYRGGTSPEDFITQLAANTLILLCQIKNSAL